MPSKEEMISKIYESKIRNLISKRTKEDNHYPEYSVQEFIQSLQSLLHTNKD